jgi:acid stress chaperone HdeA
VTLFVIFDECNVSLGICSNSLLTWRGGQTLNGVITLRRFLFCVFREKKMKPFRLAILAAAIGASPAFAEAQKPVSKWSCEEFLAVGEQFQPKVVYFASSKAVKNPSIVDIEGTEKVVPMIIDDCQKAPKESFLQKLKSAWRSIEAEADKIKKKL